MGNPIREFDADNQSSLKTRGDLVREITSRWAASSFGTSGVSLASITKIPHLGETRAPSIKSGRGQRPTSRRIATAIWLRRRVIGQAEILLRTTSGTGFHQRGGRVRRGGLPPRLRSMGDRPKRDLLRGPNRRAEQMSVCPFCQNPRKMAIA